MTDQRPAIVLFREDLRTTDNAALTKAGRSGAPVICLYVWDDRPPHAIGAAQRWWLHHSLLSLSCRLRQIGCRLHIRSGATETALRDVIAATGTDRVFWSRRYVPHHVARDKALMADLRQRGIRADSCRGRLLAEPWQVLNKDGRPYRVFTAFWNGLRRTVPTEDPLPVPGRLPRLEISGGNTVEELGLLPSGSDWSAKFHQEWHPGEDGAQALLDRFLENGARNYAAGRDFPSLTATSRLSPHLQAGEISPRQILHAAAQRLASGSLHENDVRKLHSELAWRDFNAHLLHHFPETAHEEFRPDFCGFPWQNDPQAFSLWSKGQTGYPIVDAGMRELWHTGYMHNRVRMITASFLTKHLLIDWRDGMGWFWDTLLDADIASNTMNWQWVAGCGADAAPYFRIFNPALQARKFDPDGTYIRRWVPEIAKLADRHLAEPVSAPPAALNTAGVKLGETYPLPMVNHGFARQRALDAYHSIKRSPDRNGIDG